MASTKLTRDEETDTVDSDDEVAVGLKRPWLSSKQIKSYLLLGFYGFPLCWLMVCPVFIAFEPEHHCALPPNATTNATTNATITNATLSDSPWIYEVGECSLNRSRMEPASNASIGPSILREQTFSKCPFGHDYDEEGSATGTRGLRSVVSEWDLVCADDRLAEVSSTVFMSGLPFGNLIFTPLADAYGRKWVMLITGWVSAFLGIVISRLTSYWAFCLLRAVQAAFAQGSSLIAFTLVVEMLQPRQRNLGGIAYNFFWALGMLLLSLMAYLARDWRHLYLAVCLPSVVTIAYAWLVEESVPWLYAKQLRDIRVNLAPGKTASTGKDAGSGSVAVNSESAATAESCRLQWRHLLDRRIVKRVLVMAYVAFVNNLTYYGLSLSTPVLAGDLYFNFFLAGLVEVPATVLVLVAVPFVGRRILLLCLHVLGGVALGALAFIPEAAPQAGAVALFMTGKFAISGSFTVLFLFTQEVFPTVVRSSAVGLVNAFGNVAAILAPSAFTLSKAYGSGVVNTVFGVSSLVAGVLVLLMPETLNKPLPNTLVDL